MTEQKIKFIVELNSIKEDRDFLLEVGKKPYNFDPSYRYDYEQGGEGYYDETDSKVGQILSILRNSSPKLAKMAEEIEEERGRNIPEIISRLNDMMVRANERGSLTQQKKDNLRKLINLLRRLEHEFDQVDDRIPLDV